MSRNRNIFIGLSFMVAVAFSGPLLSAERNTVRRANIGTESNIETTGGTNSRSDGTVSPSPEVYDTFRRSNFSNEFNIKTAEGINARGWATVQSSPGDHKVIISANGLSPGETYVILNHWFEPIPERGIGPSGAENDPSCTGHFQFIGSPMGTQANNKGELHLEERVQYLAPHIWVANLQTFGKVTSGGTTPPQSPDAFVIGGSLLPSNDLFADEADFTDFGAITICP
jgi:hypothetical protein